MMEALNNLRNGKLEAAFRPVEDEFFSFELDGNLTAEFTDEPSGTVTGRITGSMVVAEGEPGPAEAVYGFDGELRDAVIDPETGTVTGDFMGLLMSEPFGGLVLGTFSGEYVK